MVQIDEKILPYNDKKNPSFIVRDTREYATMKSSIMAQSVGAGCGTSSINMGRKGYLI
jgi:hypothetical protein